MANFGKISESNIVLSTLVVDDKKLLDENGVKQEALGQAFLEQLTGWPASQWIWEDGVKKNAMGIGCEWDPVNNIFWSPKPFDSWTKDIANAKWISPIGDVPELTQEEKDQNKRYVWNDETQIFDLIQY
jgi:hypothetical protein